MKKLLTALMISTVVAFTPIQADESKLTPLTSLASKYDYARTVEKLTEAFKEKGLTIFATIDHSAAAKEAGLEMKPTQVIIFGNAKGGTPLMQKSPALALQLPLKVLIAENADGKVDVRFFKASFLATSIGESEDLTAGLSKIEKLITKIVTQ